MYSVNDRLSWQIMKIRRYTKNVISGTSERERKKHHVVLYLWMNKAFKADI